MTSSLQPPTMYQSVEISDALSPTPSAPPEPPSPVSVQVSSLHHHPAQTTGTTQTNPINTKNHLGASKISSHSLVPWSTDLCDCCDNVSSCCLTCWCPCVTFGRIAEIVDRGSTSCGVSGGLYMMIMCITGCSCLYSCFYRSKLRGQYFLDERPCTDCCVHCCCEPCALCQEYRQLKNQGFDMSIGWHGNMERRKKGPPVPPFVESDMKR